MVPLLLAVIPCFCKLVSASQYFQCFANFSHITIWAQVAAKCFFFQNPRWCHFSRNILDLHTHQHYNMLLCISSNLPWLVLVSTRTTNHGKSQLCHQHHEKTDQPYTQAAINNTIHFQHWQAPPPTTGMELKPNPIPSTLKKRPQHWNTILLTYDSFTSKTR
jgi:hypothetical protein